MAVMNEKVRAKIQQEIGPHEDLLTTVKRRTLQLYGNVSRSSGSGQNHLAMHSERGKKTRQTEKNKSGKTTSGNGQAWSLPSPSGKWRTGGNEGNWL